MQAYIPCSSHLPANCSFKNSNLSMLVLRKTSSHLFPEHRCEWCRVTISLHGERCANLACLSKDKVWSAGSTPRSLARLAALWLNTSASKRNLRLGSERYSQTIISTRSSIAGCWLPEGPINCQRNHTIAIVLVGTWRGSSLTWGWRGTNSSWLSGSGASFPTLFFSSHRVTLAAQSWSSHWQSKTHQ